MINWKVPVGFAGFGAVVSLLAGIIGGNPFGVILLRLILSAGICGALGVGVNLIVNRFLPELTTGNALPSAETGEEVDIVIDEEIPLAEEVADDEILEDAGIEETGEPAGLSDGIDEGTVPADIEEGQEPVIAVEDIDESEEDVANFEDADSEPVPDAPAAEESFPEEFVPGIAAEQVTDFEDLDSLPDIDKFAPAAEESPPPSRPSRMNSQVEEVVRDQDPENLARAVRTFMKKDQ